MNGIWLISYLALWVVVIFLLLAVLVLSRQVGLLYRRLGPARARMENEGLKIGDEAPALNAIDLYGREVRLGSERGQHTLLVFISATCPVCDELAPALRSISKSDCENLALLLVSLSGDVERNREFIRRHKLDRIPLIASNDAGLHYNVTSPPYAILIDERRIVRAKGVANHLEHLESLINAAQLGYASMESWVHAQRASHESASV